MTENKKSRFTVSLPIVRGEEPFEVLYQTLTGGFALLPGGVWTGISNRIETAFDAETMMHLAGQGFVVPEETDEAAVYDMWRQQYVHDYRMIKSTVMLTRQCNLRCRYCIVEAENRSMSQAIAEAMDAFYLDRIAEKRPEQVRDCYMGGEPLLNTKVLLESVSRRHAFCRRKQVDYGFTFITNGTLLSSEGVKAMKKFGLTGLRVSLAGPAPVHDQLRVTAQNGPTYEKIMKNLQAVSGLTGITVECQYDAAVSDYRRIPEMMDDMAVRGIEIEDIAFTPILARRHDNQFFGGVGDPEIYPYLMREAANRGFPGLDIPPSNSCMADLRSRLVFNTDGAILPCPAFQSGERVYGHVMSGIDFIAEVDIRRRCFPDKCLKECELLPVCNGGCRFSAMISHGDFSGVDCHYDAWRRTLEDFIYRKANSVLEGGGTAAVQHAA